MLQSGEVNGKQINEGVVLDVKEEDGNKLIESKKAEIFVEKDEKNDSETKKNVEQKTDNNQNQNKDSDKEIDESQKAKKKEDTETKKDENNELNKEEEKE